jgi:hypothetical protein
MLELYNRNKFHFDRIGQDVDIRFRNRLETEEALGIHLASDVFDLGVKAFISDSLSGIDDTWSY